MKSLVTFEWFLRLLLVIATRTTTTSTTRAFAPPPLYSQDFQTFDSSLFVSQQEKQQVESSTLKNDNTLSLSTCLCFEQHQAVSLPESQYTPVLVTDRSMQGIAVKLRSAYDDLFRDPRQPNANRFVWDPWFVSVGDGKQGKHSMEEHDGGDNDPSFQRVPGEIQATQQQIQYSLKRVAASTLFDNDATSDATSSSTGADDRLYETLIDDLTDLASSIGLTAMTPPWVSLYTDGDMQNFHTDAPHGPMAFVLSLCSSSTDFSGGETMLLQPQLLEYWKGFDSTKGLEASSIVRYIPVTPLGRCLVFDPRIPHGVNRVSGTTQDPRRGRVVVHGWFNEPQVCWFGPWGDSEDSSNISPKVVLDAVLEDIVETLGSGEIGRVMGYLAVRIEIDTEGSVENVLSVCDTLQADWDDFRGIIGYDEADRPVMEDAVSDIRLTITEALQQLEFPPQLPNSKNNKEEEENRAVVIPFLFE